MKNEYITTGAEYGSVTELQCPREDMGTSKEYFEPHREYWENVSEFSNETMKPPADDSRKKAAAARQKKHTKLLKKVVYGIASAATVFTMAQTITPAWDIKEPVQQEQTVQEEVLIDREHQTIQPVDKPVQEALWPANIIRISCDGELTKAVAEEELAKYDLSEPFGIVLEGNITRIGKRALAEYKNLVQIQWPDSVKEIGESAFYDCKQLVIERLDTAGLTVGNNAFSYSTIEELVVSGSFEAEYTEPFEWANVKMVSYEPGLTRMPAFILNGVFTLETLEVPAGVTEIGQRAIGNCRDLREVTLPEGLTLLGKNAFYDCDKLTRVNLPGSLKTIGEQAFYECNQLVFEQLDTAGLLVGNHAFSYSTIEELMVSETFEAEYTEPFEWANVKTVSYEPGLTRMPAFILNGVFTLETLEVPAGVTEIGQRAIGNCRDLREVTLPEGLTLLGKNAFYDCDKLTRVNLPGSLKTIGEQAFYSCKQLVVEHLDMTGLAVHNRAFCYTTIRHLVISDNFEAKVGSAFEYANVGTISFEEGIIRIPNLILEGVRGVTTLIIPEGVTEIGHSAFHNCKDVTALQLPQSIRRIEASAFFGCDGLAEVRIPNAEVQIESLAFKRSDSLVLSVVEGSPAQEYAIADEIPYVVR